MGDTLDFPAFPGQPELDGMDRAQLLSCLERIQLMLEHLDELEPEDMDSDAYEVWGERHEALEDLADELDMEIPEDEDYDTVGGMILSCLRTIPEDGSRPVVEAMGLRIRVEELCERRVEWALVEKLDTAKVSQ